MNSYSFLSSGQMDHLTWLLLVNYPLKILTVEWHGFIVYSAGITAMVANLADADFRKEYRASVVATHMITEVRELDQQQHHHNTRACLSRCRFCGAWFRPSLQGQHDLLHEG